MLWDTHCHLFKEYYSDIDEIINNAKECGVRSFIVDGCDMKSNEETLELAKNNSNIFACLGIHPDNVCSYQQNDIKYIEENISNKKVIGIGEIGLDYHYSKENVMEQKSLLRTQLELAKKYKMPVVIHSREATNDTLEILKEYPSVKGVIHSFSLSIEVAREYIKMGYKLGINGVVTFKNCNLKDILKEIFPHIILETDSPYLTPHPYRGMKNEPKYIKNIAEFICENVGITLSELENITNNNIKEIFNV